MKKLLCLVLALTMLMSLALISPAAAEDWKFERKIEIVCPWGLGGGAAAGGAGRGGRRGGRAFPRGRGGEKQLAERFDRAASERAAHRADLRRAGAGDAFPRVADRGEGRCKRRRAL